MNNSTEKNKKFCKVSNENSELVKKIKEIQEIPEEIIVKFLNAAGSLSSFEFKRSDIDEF